MKHGHLPKGIPQDSKLGQFHTWFNMEWKGLFTKVKGKLGLGTIVTECVKAPIRKMNHTQGWYRIYIVSEQEWQLHQSWDTRA